MIAERRGKYITFSFRNMNMNEYVVEYKLSTDLYFCNKGVAIPCWKQPDQFTGIDFIAIDHYCAAIFVSVETI